MFLIIPTILADAGEEIIQKQTLNPHVLKLKTPLHNLLIIALFPIFLDDIPRLAVLCFCCSEDIMRDIVEMSYLPSGAFESYRVDEIFLSEAGSFACESFEGEGVGFGEVEEVVRVVVYRGVRECCFVELWIGRGCGSW